MNRRTVLKSFSVLPKSKSVTYEQSLKNVMKTGAYNAELCIFPEKFPL